MTVDDIVEDILGREQGYVDDPNDHGGETNWGISHRAFPEEDIKSLTRARARLLYLERYFYLPKLDKLPSFLHPLLFDFSVNSGANAAIKRLQKVLNVTPDGIIGPQTIEAAHNVVLDLDRYKVVTAIVGERLKFIAAICARDRSQVSFLRGWVNRCCEFLSPPFS